VSLGIWLLNSGLLASIMCSNDGMRFQLRLW